MNLTIHGTHEQILELMKMWDLGLAVFDAHSETYHVNLDAEGHSCVTETVEVPDASSPKSATSAEKKYPRIKKYPHIDLGVDLSDTLTDPLHPKKEIASPKKVKITVKDVSKVCPICDTAFTPHHGRQVYCDKCIKEYGGKCNVVAKRKRKNNSGITLTVPVERLVSHERAKVKSEPKTDAVSEDD